MKKFLTQLSLAISSTLAMPMAALAEDYSTSSTTAGIFLLILFGTLVLLGLGFFIFWIIMLIDSIKRTNWESESDKTLWLVLLLVGFVAGFGWLVAIVYYFVVKKKLDSGKQATAVSVSESAKDQQKPKKE